MISIKEILKQLICSLFYCYKFNTFLLLIPLLDKTEARYAEIARIMWDTNQWIMPQIDYGIPFWAKPPLSTWLSAGSYLLGLMSLHRLPFTQYVLILTGKMVKKSGLSFTYLVLFY
jgi:hypothetical protein